MSDYYTDEKLANQPPRVHSVERALTILNRLAGVKREMGVSEIASLTDLASGTVYRLLATLAYHGYVRQNLDTRKYSLGMRFLSVAAAAHGQIGPIARPHLTQLMQVSQETANLAVLEANRVLYVEQVPPPRMLRIFTEPGNRVPLHTAATGKVLLAYQPPHVIRSIIQETGLPPVTPNTITDRSTLLDLLECVKRQGYAIDLEEQEEGACCLATPVFTSDGQILAAMSVSGPASRLAQSRLNNLVPSIRSIAAALGKVINSIGIT